MDTQDIQYDTKDKTQNSKLVAAILAVILLVGVGFGSFFIGRASKNSGNNENSSQPQATTPYYFYVGLGTLPILYEATHMLTHTHQSYIYFGRKDTIDTTNLPKHIHNLDDNDMSSDTFDGRDVVLKKVYNKVKDIWTNDKGSKFYFFVDDLRVMLPWYVFLSNGVARSNFDIVLVSDGSGSYATTSGSMFGDFVGNDGYKNYQIYQDEFLAHLDRFEKGEDIALDWTFTTKYAYVAAQQSNLSYWMQYPEFAFWHNNVSSQVRTELINSKMKKRQPFDIVDSLSESSREWFFEHTLNNPNHPAGSAKDLLDNLFVHNTKPSLIISGTHRGDTQPPDDLEDAVQLVFDKFGDEYNIVYKPHPAQNIDADYFDAIKDKGVTILPAQLPMEVILWAYPNAKVGGYQSTLYMSAHEGQVAFFFGEDWHLGGLSIEILQILNNKGQFGKVEIL